MSLQGLLADRVDAMEVQPLENCTAAGWKSVDRLGVMHRMRLVFQLGGMSMDLPAFIG